MEIRNDDFYDDIDDLDDGFELEEPQDGTLEELSPEPLNQEEDFIDSLLKTKGILDRNKIIFEDEEGTIEERPWDDLSNEEKFNILNYQEDPETGLDDTEILLINAIRSSGLSPNEYIQYIQKSGVDNYILNSQQNSLSYSIDQYNDDDLYVYDLMSRTGITLEEAQEDLVRAKTNESLFDKQIKAIRNEYLEIEKELLLKYLLELDQLAQEQYNQFSQSIAYEIEDFTDFSGYSIEMDRDDKAELYDFITGFDAAGNNHFAKALSDPKLVVQMAWFALNGNRMIDDITDYFQKEITNVRRLTLATALAKKGGNLVYKDKGINHNNDDYDLDDF